MLLPHPESNLALNTLVLGSDLICLLREKEEFVLAETVLKEFLKSDEVRSPDNFFDTLTFLYTIGLIEYKGYKIRLKQNDNAQPTLF